MEKEYWDRFYKEKHIITPTDFAKFCCDYIRPNSNIIELGCGNGRDSYFFAKKKYHVIAIDESSEPKDSSYVDFYKTNLKDFYKTNELNADVIYSRFFLHYLSDKELVILLRKCPNCLFMAEIRAYGDKPKIYPNHQRILRKGEYLLNIFIKNNFKILYYKLGRDMAVYKNENPLVIRIIAEKI